ncbi:inositol monophosphatase family protein [Bacteroides sp. 51]|uniref:inositol monophosphatase family protein n=1 Tax=Bacteroides sp. 51 TaxID=2302938 RepID=UPI0013D3B9E0|nr:inositol monophosphatase family protein [Bacteroides sp. 51]NDV82726.1 inositol monophosphatase [Bacteroides sp. 51]
MDLKQITLQVCRIATDTGIYLSSERKLFKKENVLEKRDHDYVSYVDREAEKMTVKALSALLPEAGFITEEGTIEQSNTGLNWVIDPLDGTTNFIQDFPPYCVSIALREGEDILLGVVYEVCRNECFYAWKGGGAYLNEHLIHVSDNPMEKAFIGLELPYETEKYKPVILNAFNQLYGKVSSIRICGSAATALCYVAAGRYDAWGEAYLKIWDYAAGVIIVREAGGKVTDFTGGEKMAGTHHIIASNEIIHEEFRTVLLDNNSTIY